METTQGTDHTFESTTFVWERRMVRRPAGGQMHSAAKPHRMLGLPRWPARRPLRLTIKYRGGPEGWVEIHARGRVVRYPGYTQVVDVLRELTNGGL